MYVDSCPKQAYQSLSEAVGALADSVLEGWRGQGAVRLRVGKDAEGVVYYHVDESIPDCGGIDYPAPISREELVQLLSREDVPCLYEVKEEIGACNPRYQSAPNSRDWWDGPED